MAVAELQIHPAAEVFPILSGTALDELAADIRANGLRETIKRLPDGRVIDGRCRLAAMSKAKIEPTDEHFETVEIPEDQSPYQYVMSLNLHRRHLPNGTRVALAAELAEALKLGRQIAKSKSGNVTPAQAQKVLALGHVSGETTKGRVNEIAADLFAVSPAQVARMQKVMKEDPKAAEAVKRNELKPAAAHGAVSGNGSTDDSGKRFLAKLDGLGEQLDGGKVKLSKAQRGKALAAAEALVARLSEDAQV